MHRFTLILMIWEFKAVAVGTRLNKSRLWMGTREQVEILSYPPVTQMFRPDNIKTIIPYIDPTHWGKSRCSLCPVHLANDWVLAQCFLCDASEVHHAGNLDLRVRNTREAQSQKSLNCCRSSWEDWTTSQWKAGLGGSEGEGTGIRGASARVIWRCKEFMRLLMWEIMSVSFGTELCCCLRVVLFSHSKWCSKDFRSA